ncbi:MAG: succinate dehydrogenase cytochrome b subunit [Bacteroidia bacterium]|nr:succinate dehydrogenase cytochrome b subunit [Bacteroidia bacterium]
MNTLAYLYKYSVGRKVIMALSGLFLVSFLFVHVGGNMLLFRGDDGVAFNAFTRFMSTNPVIGVLEWVLAAGFIVHIVYGILLEFRNRQARPDRYEYTKGASTSSSWASRNMITTGLIVLAFLAVHVTTFWGGHKFGHGEEVGIEQAYREGWKIKEAIGASLPLKNQYGEVLLDKKGYLTADALEALTVQGVTTVRGISMTKIVKDAFAQWFIAFPYAIVMIILALHLSHGFQSGFRSLGLVHKKYTPLIIGAGLLISVVIPLIFASMPIFFFFQSL